MIIIDVSSFDDDERGAEEGDSQSFEGVDLSTSPSSPHIAPRSVSSSSPPPPSASPVDDAQSSGAHHEKARRQRTVYTQRRGGGAVPGILHGDAALHSACWIQRSGYVCVHVAAPYVHTCVISSIRARFMNDLKQPHRCLPLLVVPFGVVKAFFH